jgi:hypothetical protein
MKMPTESNTLSEEIDRIEALIGPTFGAAQTEAELNTARASLLGKDGVLDKATRRMRGESAASRSQIGPRLNLLMNQIRQGYEARRTELGL